MGKCSKRCLQGIHKRRGTIGVMSKSALWNNKGHG